MNTSASLACQALITRYLGSSPPFGRATKPNQTDLQQPSRAVIATSRSDQACLLALFYHGNVRVTLLSIFFVCFLVVLILSSCLNLELGFPLTGLEKMESLVGLPDFSGPFCEEDYAANQESHYQEHFASQIVLRRILVEFHGVLSHSMFRYFTPSPPTIAVHRVTYSVNANLMNLGV